MPSDVLAQDPPHAHALRLHLGHHRHADHPFGRYPALRGPLSAEASYPRGEGCSARRARCREARGRRGARGHSKGAAPCGAAPLQVYVELRQLDLADVDRLLLAVVARGDLELDSLALVEGLEALALDLGEVSEHVVATLDRDEAVALVRVEPLDGTFSHETHPIPAPTGQNKSDPTLLRHESGVSGRRHSGRVGPHVGVYANPVPT